MVEIPKSGFARLSQILGEKEITPEQARRNAASGKPYRKPRPAVTPVLPISRAKWYEGVREGKYPKPIKLSERISVWRWEDIRAILEGTYRRSDAD